MQPLLNGYSTYIKGNILEIAFRPCLEKLGFFKSEPKAPADNKEKKSQNDEANNPSATGMMTTPPP